MKLRIFAGIALIGITVLGCLGMQSGNARINRTLEPKLEFSAPRIKVNAPLSIVLNAKITPEAVRNIGMPPNQVSTVFSNYREALGKTISAAFQDNFSSVILNEAETKQGFELLVLHTKFGESEDSIEYHCVLTKNGKDIFEVKGKVIQPPTVIGSSVYTWQDDTANYQASAVSKNIVKLAEDLNNKIFFGGKLAKFGIK